MYSELKELIRERRYHLALKRMRNASLLRELGAPDSMISKADDLLNASKIDLGDEFDRIEAAYPDYLVWAEVEEKTASEWESRCMECRYMGEMSDLPASTKWCNKFSFESRPFPEICPEYEAMETK